MYRFAASFLKSYSKKNNLTRKQISISNIRPSPHGKDKTERVNKNFVTEGLILAKEKTDIASARDKFEMTRIPVYRDATLVTRLPSLPTKEKTKQK